MKEADIVFDDWYAVEVDSHVQRWKIDYKHPAAPGKSRSRMYRISNENGLYRDTDASKIRMPWVKYERTPEYSEKRRAQVQGDLDGRVYAAMSDWMDTLREYLTSLLGPYAPPNRPVLTMTNGVPPRAHTAVSTAEFLDQVEKATYLNIPLKALIKLGDIPLPPTASIDAAIDQRKEVNDHLLVQSLPLLERRAMQLAEFNHEMWRNDETADYIRALILSGTPGPHPPLVKLAEYSIYPVDPTSSPQFAYLLAVDDDEDGEDV